MRKVKASQWFTGCLALVIIFAFLHRPVIGFCQCWNWQAFFSPFYIFYWLFGLEWPFSQSLSNATSSANGLVVVVACLLGFVCVVAILIFTIVSTIGLLSYTFDRQDDEPEDDWDEPEDEPEEPEEEPEEDEGPGGCRRGR